MSQTITAPIVPSDISKQIFEISKGEPFTPGHRNYLRLITQYAPLVDIALSLAGGDKEPFFDALADPETAGAVKHIFHDMRVKYDMGKAAEAIQARAREKQPDLWDELHQLEPDHTCGGFVHKSSAEDKLRVRYVGKRRAKTSIQKKGRRMWRSCPGCAHDRIVREVAKIKEEQKLSTLRYAIIPRDEYKKTVKRFNVWRERNIAKWKKAIIDTPAGEKMPLMPRDIAYIGYVIAGAVVLVHNQPSTMLRGEERFPSVDMPTEPTEVYKLVQGWILDAPQGEHQRTKFILGSDGFGGRFSGTRGRKVESLYDECHKALILSLKNEHGLNQTHIKETLEANGITPTKKLSKSPAKLDIVMDTKHHAMIERLLKPQNIKAGGFGDVALTAPELIEELQAHGIQYEVEGSLEDFVASYDYSKQTQINPVVTTCHKPPPQGSSGTSQPSIFGGETC